MSRDTSDTTPIWGRRETAVSTHPRRVQPCREDTEANADISAPSLPPGHARSPGAVPSAPAPPHCTPVGFLGTSSFSGSQTHSFYCQRTEEDNGAPNHLLHTNVSKVKLKHGFAISIKMISQETYVLLKVLSTLVNEKTYVQI